MRREVPKTRLNLEAYYKALVAEECRRAGIGCKVFVSRTSPQEDSTGNQEKINRLFTQKVDI